jgi:hypothetical protein
MFTRLVLFASETLVRDFPSGKSVGRSRERLNELGAKREKPFQSGFTRELIRESEHAARPSRSRKTKAPQRRHHRNHLAPWRTLFDRARRARLAHKRRRLALHARIVA